MRKIDVTPQFGFFILFIIIIVLYSLFQARFIILGPQITVESPKNGEVLSDSLVVIKGSAKNISFISLDDRPIYIDESGNWSEKLLASPGASIISIKARDRFGRQTEKQIEVFLN